MVRESLADNSNIPAMRRIRSTLMRDVLALARSAKLHTRQTFSSVSHPRIIYLPVRDEFQQRGFAIVRDLTGALKRGDDLTWLFDALRPTA